MALSPFQYQWGNFTFGAGTDVQIAQEEGLRSLAPVRNNDVNQPRDDGSYAGLNFLGVRTVTLTLSITRTTVDFETVIAGIANAFQNDSDPTTQTVLQFMYPGWSTPRQVTGRVMRVGFITDLNYQFHRIDSLPVEILCNDPLIYDTVLKTASTTVPSINTSLRFNVIFNAIFGTASGGTMSVTNNGNVPTLPVFTISGPVTNPMIYIPSTNQYMKFNIQLLAGDSLVIDTVMSTVTLNGSASRFNTIATGSQWLSFPVGTTSIVVSSSDGTYPTGNLFSVQYRDAYGWC